jgi:hypothetical protein
VGALKYLGVLGMDLNVCDRDGVPDLPSGEGNYRFGGDVTQTIRLPNRSTTSPLVINCELRD